MPPNLESFISGKCLPGGKSTMSVRGRIYASARVGILGGASSTSILSDSCKCIAHLQESHTTLDLRRLNTSARATHSIVMLAPLTLPSIAATPSMRGAVAVKLAKAPRSDRRMLGGEGRIYNVFPRKLQEGCSQTPIPVPPVVPKFYGYYAPSLAEFDGQAHDELNDEGGYPNRHMTASMSPILLLEQFGKPISAKDIYGADGCAQFSQLPARKKGSTLGLKTGRNSSRS
ncbi:hypothetical protein F5148DRAFT_437005 [Russula earlei]|uniref:Uncharacterized protein n=1 Tax=Russula earlei TaxID=71964 RepID=A0ACC0UH18_9AGAM|nr:hypothetical protein F5148DRAFT_437005 [Russula earlei]